MIGFAICAVYSEIESHKHRKRLEEIEVAEFERGISCLSDQDKAKARLERKMHKERMAVERERISAINKGSQKQEDTGMSMSQLIFLSTLIK